VSLPLPTPTPPVVNHCYRHPDREAGRSCTRCGRPACSDCLVQAAVGSHCLECAKAAKPDVKTRAQLWNSRQLTPVTVGLIAVNVLVFIVVGLNNPSSLSPVSSGVSHLQADLGLNRLLLQGYKLVFQGNRIFFVPTGGSHEWYRLVTAGFLHFGILHIAVNMYLLYQLGQLLERLLGGWRFALLYFAGLLAGSLGSLLLDGHTAIAGGASGAVFCLMAAAAVGLHRQGINVFSTGIGTTLLLNIVLTFSIPGISKGGHVGGALAGALLGYVMMAPTWRAHPKWVTYAAPLAVAVASVVASVVLVNA
jgi:membrane associated rhomboid family serine protease